MIILVILVIIIIAIIIIKRNQNDVTDNPKTEIEELASKVLYSNDLKKKELEIITKEKHKIKKIYMDKEDSFIWKCPNCEVENRSTNKKCYVCNHNI